jgi:hypothetical protein
MVPLPPAASLLVSCSHCAKSVNSSPIMWIPSGNSWLNSSAAETGPGWRAAGVVGSAGMRACWGKGSAGWRGAGILLAAARWPADHWRPRSGSGVPSLFRQL